jgi:hypothetical protein
MKMVRIQIYLLKAGKSALRAIGKQRGKSQSELIREAIDRFIEQSQEVDRNGLLRHGRGIWKNRTDLRDFATLRTEMNRPLSRRAECRSEGA